MKASLLLAAALLALSGACAPTFAEQDSDARKSVENTVPRKGATRLTNAAYRQIVAFLDRSRQIEPQTEWMASLSWTDIRSAPSREAAERGEWSNPVRGWSLGSFRRGDVPDRYFETIRGLKILIVYEVEPWRRQGRKMIDFRDGRFVTVEATAPKTGR